MDNYHVVPDAQKGWVLHKEGDSTVLKAAELKDQILVVLPVYFSDKKASVKIHREDGTIEEERTYPRSADPRESKG